MSAFYLAMPLGSALGIKLGAYIATRYDWHMAFFVVGVPSLVAALVALVLPEPVRGASETVDVDRLQAHERAGASREDYLDLMVNSSYTYSVFGMAAYTFAIGGMLVWVPNYLFNTRHFDQDRATSILSLVTFVAAILGMSVGGWLADRMARSRPQALFVVPGRRDARLDPVRPGGAVLDAGADDLRRDLRRRGADVHQHRPVQRDHRQRRAAEPPRRGVRHRDLRPALPGRHLVPLADRQGGRHCSATR